MKFSEMSRLTNEEKKNKLESLKSELFKLKFQHSIRQIGNTAKITLLKKDVARLYTTLNNKIDSI